MHYVKFLSYLIPEVYSKFCQVSKMMRQIENLGIVRTVYSGIFRHIFSNIQPCSDILRNVKVN